MNTENGNTIGFDFAMKTEPLENETVESEESNAIADALAEPFADQSGQYTLPEPSLVKDRRMDVIETEMKNFYGKASNCLKNIGEHAVFFKKLSDYLSQLDTGLEANIIRSNLAVAEDHCESLRSDIEATRSWLGKIEECVENQRKFYDEDQDDGIRPHARAEEVGEKVSQEASETEAI